MAFRHVFMSGSQSPWGPPPEARWGGVWVSPTPTPAEALEALTQEQWGSVINSHCGEPSEAWEDWTRRAECAVAMAVVDTCVWFEARRNCWKLPSLVCLRSFFLPRCANSGVRRRAPRRTCLFDFMMWASEDVSLDGARAPHCWTSRLRVFANRFSSEVVRHARLPAHLRLCSTLEAALAEQTIFSRSPATTMRWNESFVAFAWGPWPSLAFP